MKSMSLYNKIFFVFIITTLLSIGTVSWYGMQSTSKAYIESAYKVSYQNSSTLEVAIESRLDHVPKDVVFATNFYALEKYLIWHAMGEETKASQWRQVFSDALIDFLYTKKDYYQARVIDLDGNELVNAKYNTSSDTTILIKDKDLQNKKNKDYVQVTKRLKKGEFFVSKMNLNKEHGKIETPHIPVISYSTPIVSNNGKVIAIFVINIYAKQILDLIQAQSAMDSEKGVAYFLMDKDGNYLYHQDTFRRWNAQLKNGHNFNKDYFEIKEKFEDKEHGYFRHDEKIYSFHKVHPLAEHTEEYWYIVSSIEEEIALIQLEEFKLVFLFIVCLVILVSFFFVRSFVRGITDPLSLVSNQLLALSFGEIKKEDIDYKSDDEVGKIVQSTAMVVHSIEKVIKQANSVAQGDLSKKVELLGENDSLGSSINDMTKRLREIESLAEHLSVGNYSTQIVAKSSDDKLGVALISMIAYLESVTKVAESVAKGEIDINYKAVSADDRLGIAMLKMVSYLKTILNHANAISKEDFSQTIRAKSNNDELGTAMVTMTDILSHTHRKNKEETYFSEGIGEFTDKLMGIDSTNELASVALTITCRYVEASSGVLYLYNKEKQSLDMETSYAFDESAIKQRSFKLGECVVGQVGSDKKFVLLKDVSDDKYAIKTATTSSSPKEVFIYPLIHEGLLFGVAEIISFTSFSKIKKDYLLKAAGIFATSIYTTSQNAQIKTLLEKSQRAYEELQVQSEELQESNVQMEEQQQQLTVQSHELQDKNDNLAKAKKEIDQRAEDLEKASKYKSEFLANMSHELRTPLNSIILLSKLLSKNQSDTLDEKDVEKSVVINKAGNDLLLLINDILDLSKIESGNMELENTSIYSGDIINDVKGLFEAIAEQKDLDFVVKDNFNDCFVSDRTKLAQVLKNLLSNAIKFTKEGMVSLEVIANEDNIEFIVSDTGTGIPSDKLEAIFEAFKQVDGSISREFGGTGLGLSISKTIVELMSGTIEVESTLTQGATFRVSIPMITSSNQLAVAKVDTDNILDKTKLMQEEEELDASEDIKGKNILIVDDDSRNIFTLTSTLENLGADIYSSFNGLEAIELLEQTHEKIDLILMDVMMPVMDGVETIKKLKSDDRYKDIPIIAITAKTMPEDKQLCLDSGANDYLSKPLDNNALVSVIKAWIR